MKVTWPASGIAPARAALSCAPPEHRRKRKERDAPIPGSLRGDAHPSENLPHLSTTRPLRPPASIAEQVTTNTCLRLLNEDCETQPNALRENQFMIRRDAPSIAASNASRRSATALRRHLECRPGVVS
ncbi:hypothetical protein Bsp3421_001330 [Burkholderia sp. FERM BP-3421]|jgi:hypothetical protein|uniref:hypothetical protein n=1 Tax=Burkholderia sp. FERM BP-3421 TaxID=1494466 RepID=UPI00235E2DD2|nr:hypothetical protein [Burkholderia sp. FERM BP-3421]WDD91412.1 hypothetical protein Bsp3421_001330 [Burkholderia sp. FERM BP-3421]